MSKELIERLEELLLLNVANKERIKGLTALLITIHNDLGEVKWSSPEENSGLLEAIRGRIDIAMGWTDEESH